MNPISSNTFTFLHSIYTKNSKPIDNKYICECSKCYFSKNIKKKLEKKQKK